MISSLFSSPINPSTTPQPMNPASRPSQSQAPPLKKSYSLKSLKDSIRYISPPIPSRGYQVYRPTLQNAAQSLENLRFEYLLRSCVMQDICDGKAPGFEGSITHELGFIENKDTSPNSSAIKTLLDGCSILVSIVLLVDGICLVVIYKFTLSVGLLSPSKSSSRPYLSKATSILSTKRFLVTRSLQQPIPRSQNKSS